MNRFTGVAFFLLTLLLIVLGPAGASAYQVLPGANVPVSGDFLLSQTKTEVELKPGASAVREISLTNRSGADLAFDVLVEDFSASSQANQNIDLLGATAGQYSLKNYLLPETDNFTLRHGETIILPVTINIPANAQPGGLYGAVIFSAQTAGGGNIRPVSRLASLFFVRVSGEVLEKGELLDFSSSRTLYFLRPLEFEFNYKNTGNIYLNPYGELRITSVFGREVSVQRIAPYFVMPGAVRQQIEKLSALKLPGMYQAKLRLNRGYGNYIDQKSVYFFVLPPYYIAGAVIVLALLSLGYWRIKKLLRQDKQAKI